MTDITHVPSLFRLWIFKVVVVLDVFSRFPLSVRVFTKEPTSAEVAALVQEAADRHGKPKHFVTYRALKIFARCDDFTLRPWSGGLEPTGP